MILVTTRAAAASLGSSGEDGVSAIRRGMAMLDGMRDEVFLDGATDAKAAFDQAKSALASLLDERAT